MIPKEMEAFLRQRLPERTWSNRLVREDGMCFMEFGPMDVERLARLGIQVDRLGPKVVTCLWDEESPLEVGGYLVIDNLAMGRPSMGGIRMLPGLTPTEAFNLARGMTLKNAAASLPYGGGKAVLLADPKLPALKHTETVRRFARLLFRYRDIYLPGPDVGTTDADMKTVAIENGLDLALSKPADMGGNQVDRLGAGGGGLVIAIQALLEEMPRLKDLPQFSNLHVPEPEEVTALFQGFGAVGGNAARFLVQWIPGARVNGISDTRGYLFSENGLPIEQLYAMSHENRLVTQRYYLEHICSEPSKIKFSTDPNDLLRESAFCLIPAAHITNYIDTDPASNPSMTVEHMGRFSVIVEGANTYSPDPARQAARARMERAIYRERGILIVTDYLVNSGGVIFAAQEHLIKTPNHLRIPDEMLGDRQAVDHWLLEHARDLQELAEKRQKAAEKAREDVIRRNIRELVDLLVSDADMLPYEAAETISIQRITQRERARTAKDIMERIVTVSITSSVCETASLMVETGCPLLAVVNAQEELVGVITDWDITRASAEGTSTNAAIQSIMTSEVISAAPDDSILEVMRKLEYHEISSVPIVDGNCVVGMISTDVLARRSLYPLLISK